MTGLFTPTRCSPWPPSPCWTSPWRSSAPATASSWPAATCAWTSGFDYDPAEGDFDHHQREFAEARAQRVGYASFGLIWREYGARVCGGDAELAAQLDQSLV